MGYIMNEDVNENIMFNKEGHKSKKKLNKKKFKRIMKIKKNSKRINRH